ncbi:methylosome protein WDR77-like [Rhodnius prolixus]|uniref:methylosome protein WDR77-like n=1 Tax=Rhodnius prolixus TaxID=13249 RepID=UPI003D18A59E
MEVSAQDRIQESGDSKPYNFSVVPFRIEQHLEFIDISEDGYLLLGSSNLVLNYWNGSLWYFKDADLAPEKERSLTGHGCDYSIACGKFLDIREKVIVGDDSGAITVYFITTFENDTIHVIPQMTSLHHDSSITALSVTSSKAQSVSAGNDLAINIWDNETLVSEFKYMPAHTRTITCVMTSPEESSSVFASSSLDGSTLLWDRRMNKAACSIKQTQNYGLTALSWKNGNEIAIGSQAGYVAVTDIRAKKDIIAEPVMDCSIHNIIFDNNRGLLGVCGDSTSVKVWDPESKNIVYTDERHTGLVRGLAWHPKSQKLYSCGFDKQIFTHQVTTLES